MRSRDSRLTHSFASDFSQAAPPSRVSKRCVNREVSHKTLPACNLDGITQMALNKWCAEHAPRSSIATSARLVSALAVLAALSACDCVLNPAGPVGRSEQIILL